MAGQHPRFPFVTTLSKPEAEWTGVIGRVTALVQDRITSVRNLTVYLCGNSGMIQEVAALIQARGLCPIHKEKYYDAEQGRADRLVGRLYRLGTQPGRMLEDARRAGVMNELPACRPAVSA